MAIRLDVSGMLRRAVANGFDPGALGLLMPRLEAAHQRFESGVASGALGFRELEAQDALRAEARSFARAIADEELVVLGIGGSALGAIALRTALLPHGWNSLSRSARGGRPRLHVLDNVDPRTIGALLDQLDLARTRFIVISKSGSTAETMAQYLVLRERVERVGLSAKDRFILVTDPVRGALREIGVHEGIPTFTVPANVGGRFSVLTPVGLLAAEAVGIDTEAIVAGALAMRDRCTGAALRSNPALAFAALQWRAHEEAGQGIHVLMPYRDALRDLAPWFVQLWAESLGKSSAEGVAVGPTPLAALGATDQHAQVQLFMEGPANKTITFVTVRDEGADLSIPTLDGTPESLRYLQGHSLGELLEAERRATAGALARAGRPTMTIELDRVDPWHIGGLLMFFELATIYAGALYGVDPLDQPGVELGKQLTYYQFGHPDWGKMAPIWEAIPPSDPDWVL